jgi:hypothetical protein
MARDERSEQTLQEATARVVVQPCFLEHEAVELSRWPHDFSRMPPASSTKEFNTRGRTPTILTCVRAFSESREKLPRLWPLAIMNKYAQF